MEMEEKKTQKSYSTNKQYFYFNDEGKLVVESNKGVWVDGERYVKMYGEFVCNAKTMGEIIHQLRGVTVEVAAQEKLIIKKEFVKEIFGVQDEHTFTNYCVLGASKERIEEYEKELAKHCYVNEEIKELSKQFNDASDREIAERKAIERFNRLPWWKRMFKKVEVK